MAFRLAPESYGFTVMLGVLAALPALSIDISAPTLVLLPEALATSESVAGLTLSLFMCGFAFGQLGAGPFSDRAGRRQVLLAGLATFALGGLACVLSPSGSVLAVSRLVQGLGAGVCAVLSFAMVQDLFEGEAARTKRAYVTVVFGAVPIFAPALGALIIAVAGWRAVHGLLTLAGGALLLMSWQWIEETLPIVPEVAAGTPSIALLLTDFQFLGLATANALSYAVIFAYIAGSPLVIMGVMKFPSTIFAGVFASTAVALTAGAWVSGRLSRRGLGSPALVSTGLSVALLAAATLALLSIINPRSRAIFIPPLLITLFARGIVAPNLQHLAIERARAQAGTASAIVGVTQLLSGAVASAVVATLLARYGAGAVAVPMALLAAAALAAWCRTTRGGTKTLANYR